MSVEARASEIFRAGQLAKDSRTFDGDAPMQTQLRDRFPFPSNLSLF